MKRIYSFIAILISLLNLNLAFSTVINQPSGTISMHQTVPVGGGLGWEVNIGQNKQVRVTFTTEFTYGTEILIIYETDSNGNWLRDIASTTTYTSGSGVSLNANGKFKIYYQNNSVASGNVKGFDLQFSPDNSLMTSQDLFVGGKAGIGTTSPTYKLDVNGDVSVGLNNSTLAPTGYGAKLLLNGLYDTGNDPTWIARYNTAPDNTEIRVNLGDNIHGDDKFVVGSTYCIDQLWHPAMTVQNNGYVGIGTYNPQYTLDVKGKIHTQEIIVDLNTPPADYVFKPEYKLRPLHEVEAYVKENSHLPEIPSADEITQNGLSMGEMQNKLLQKVEELTLYVIEQQKRINRLEKQSRKRR